MFVLNIQRPMPALGVLNYHLRERTIMNKMNLYKCAQALSVKWKSFFGLGIE